jgi:hypothetical protein
MTVVRPDGYVGLCSEVADSADLVAWLILTGMTGAASRAV